MSERTVQRVGAKVVVRSIDNAGCTMQALTVTSKLRLQGSVLAAALARPDVQSTLTDVSWRTGAGHVTGVSVVYGEPEPQLIRVRDTATGAVAEAKVVWQGSDGALDQDLEELMPDIRPGAGCGGGDGPPRLRRLAVLSSQLHQPGRQQPQDPRKDGRPRKCRNHRRPWRVGKNERPNRRVALHERPHELRRFRAVVVKHQGIAIHNKRNRIRVR